MDEQNRFLSIDGVEIEDAEEGDYTAYEQELGVSDRMISGRRVEELRAKIWIVEIGLATIEIDALRLLQDRLRTRREHELFFLPDTGSTELVTGKFHLTTLPAPSLTRWRSGEQPSWSGFTLRFEEIDGHD